MVKTESYKEDLLESLQDSTTSAEYLTACLDDGDVDVFLLALRDVAEAQGGIRKLAGRARLNRENLYRMLSRSGNPSLTSRTRCLAPLDSGWRLR
jgi:probable addiction module antidote protein